MRLHPLTPEDMDETQRGLHEEMRPAVEAKLRGFVSQDDDGALLGPFAPMLRWPAWGRGMWEQTKAMLEHTVLPRTAHEVAILVVGAAFRTPYELYAHQRVAERTDLSTAKIGTIVAGQRPADLSAEEAAAHDLAAALSRGGPVPDATWATAVDVLGDEGAAELVFLTSSYAAVSVLLNGFAMPVPDGEM